MAVSDKTASEVISAYYDSWIGGADAFNVDRLRTILAPDLVFEGPLAGRRVGVDGFLAGLGGVAKAVKSFRMVQQLHDGNQVSSLYDCELSRPEGTFRFAEFFRVEHGRIQTINLSYDGTEFRKLAT